MEDLGQTTSGMYLVKLTPAEYAALREVLGHVLVDTHAPTVTTTQDVMPAPPKRKARKT